MLRLRLVYIATLWAACSPVSDPSNVPDAAIDAPDTSPLRIVASTPADMGKRVSVLSPISLFFNRRLDEATVTAQTVRLRYSLFGDGWTYLYADISYDDAANHKVSIVPAQPLLTGASYEVVVSGVEDTLGNQLTNGSVRFRTYVNAPLRSTYFDATGTAVTAWTDYQLDADGNMTSNAYKNAPGPDTVWFTNDDVVSCCAHRTTYDDEGRPTEYRYFGDMGPDGKPGTLDDVVTSMAKSAYDPGHRQMVEYTYFNGPGGDGMWGTSDDQIQGYTAYGYTSEGIRAWISSYRTPGGDGMWKTADDTGLYWTEYVADASGNIIREILRSSGPDGIPRTPDDTIDNVYEKTYDARHNLVREVWKGGPGTDNVWLTSDDRIDYWSRLDLDANGLLLAQWYYSAAGPDSMWLTADDQVSSFYKRSYDDRRQLVEQVGTSGAGPDMQWGTADDEVSYYNHVAYEANGNQKDLKYYGRGRDNVFKTADDVVASDLDFDVGR